MQFHSFFMECHIRETNPIMKMLFYKMAFNEGGGLIFKRGNHYYLSLEDNMEFKIPPYYDEKEHANLTKFIKRNK